MLPRRRSILRIWNGWLTFISGVTSRIGRMSTCERGRNATAPSRSTVKPPLTWLKMTPVTFSLFLKARLELAPALFAPRLVARQHRLAERVLDALQIDFDGVADLDFVAPAGTLEFLERDAPLGLQADVDDREVLLDADDGPLDDGPFRQIAAAEGLFEQGGEVFARWRGSGASGHTVSKAVRRRVELRAFRTRGLWAPQGPTATAGKPAGRRANRAVGTMVQSPVRRGGARSGAWSSNRERACTPHLGPLG